MQPEQIENLFRQVLGDSFMRTYRIVREDDYDNFRFHVIKPSSPVRYIADAMGFTDEDLRNASMIEWQIKHAEFHYVIAISKDDMFFRYDHEIEHMLYSQLLELKRLAYENIAQTDISKIALPPLEPRAKDWREKLADFFTPNPEHTNPDDNAVGRWLSKRFAL